MAKEIWRDIKGWEGLYQVSNTGFVKSLPKGTWHSTRILKPGLNGWGYHQVRLCRNTVYKFLAVHRLVCQAFLPNPENKGDVNHKNFVKTDNRLENLEWMTRKENCQHAVANRIFPLGEKNGNSKLDEDKVRKIRRMQGNQYDIADLFGVSQHTISQIKMRKAWAHVAD